jgi:hypothetical protein
MLEPPRSVPELGDVLVVDGKFGQCCGERVLIKLRVSTRPRDCTNVNDKLDFRVAQQPNEFGYGTCRVSHGE